VPRRVPHQLHPGDSGDQLQITVTRRCSCRQGERGAADRMRPSTMLRTLAQRQGRRSTDSLRLEYGFSLDAVSFMTGAAPRTPPHLRYRTTSSSNSATPRVPRHVLGGDLPERELQATSARWRYSLESRYGFSPCISFRPGLRVGYHGSGIRSYNLGIHENTSNGMMIDGANGLFPAGNVFPTSLRQARYLTPATIRVSATWFGHANQGQPEATDVQFRRC
jgi:hypothetical protein